MPLLFCDLHPGNGVIFIKLQAAQLQQPPIIVGVCYLPPQGSPQLQMRDAQSRCSSITDHITSASALGPVVLAGDFNARVGILSDHWAASLGDSIPAQRQHSDSFSNSHGRLLMQLCEESALVLCTGRTASDIPATHSYRSYMHGGTSCMDHFMVTAGLFPVVRSCGVAPQRPDSNHLPLVMQLQLPLACGLFSVSRTRWVSSISHEMHRA